MKYLILSILISYSFQSISQEIDEKLEWSEHANKNYSINHPSDWTLNESGIMGTDYILFSPSDAPEDQFQENVNLIVQDITGFDLDLEKFTNISIPQIQNLITDSKIVAQDKLNAQNKDFMRLNYTGSQGKFKLHFLQYYWVESDKAYILTFTAEADKMESYHKLGTDIMDSFRFD